MAKKEEHKTDLLESSEVLAEKLEVAENWVERNPKTIIGITSAILLVVAAFFGYKYLNDKQDAEAQREMFQAIHYYESDSLDLALDGDGNNLGFLAITEEYPRTNAANLANFYAGSAYLKQGKYELALLYLEDFSSSDFLIQARAYSLMGDAHMEQKNYEEAASFYGKAANYQPNKYYSPAYMMKQALAYEKAENPDKAKAVYSDLIDKYWDASEVANAKKFKARLESNQ